MNISKKGSKLITGALLLMILIAAGADVWYSRNVQATQESNPTNPKIRSEVPGVEIESVTFMNNNHDVKVIIRNNTGVGIISYTLSSGDYSTTLEPAILTDELTILASPGKTHEVMFASANLRNGHPLILSAALFADGSDRGSSKAVEHIKGLHKEAKEDRQKKGGGLQ
jgi:hypothetical protein